MLLFDQHVLGGGISRQEDALVIFRRFALFERVFTKLGLERVVNEIKRHLREEIRLPGATEGELVFVLRVIPEG